MQLQTLQTTLIGSDGGTGGQLQQARNYCGENTVFPKLNRGNTLRWQAVVNAGVYIYVTVSKNVC